MKKTNKLMVVLLVMVLTLIPALTGCGNNSSDTDASAKPSSAAPESKAPESVAPETTTPESVAPASPTPEVVDPNAPELARNETLYTNGQQWGTPNDFNPLSSNSNCWAINADDDARPLMYETLYMWNQVDGKMYPLLADGDYVQDGKKFTIKIKKAAKWSDGTALTAKDCVWTYEAHKRLETGSAAIWDYIEKVEATDDYTFVITAKEDPYNPLKILENLPRLYVLPEHYFSAKETELGKDDVKTFKNDTDPVYSGAYKPMYYSESKIILQRDDNYWGQDASMWGKLPAPKYMAHNIYSSNDGNLISLKDGSCDVSQSFLSEVWKLWEDGADVSTYLEEKPYYMCVTMPMAVINTTKKYLSSNVVRKAIAMAIDYEGIANKAMSGYTPLMSDVPPCLMNPTQSERDLVDMAALKDLQWSGKQIDEAKKMLDDASIVDSNGDGVREFEGTEIVFTVQCPKGWTDWNSSLEMVAEAANAIGFKCDTLWTEATEWTTNMQTNNFDIIMNSYAGTSVSNPWTRIYQIMYNCQAKEGENAYWNFGRYSNTEADKLIDKIPTLTDAAEIKAAYTELNKMYLTDVPAIALMYRPSLFHTVNESVWTGWPTADNGVIPPTCATDGYGFATLFELEAAQ